MKTRLYTFPGWQVEGLPEDGGRLSRLRYRGLDLLTPPPTDFRPPTRDHGRYETRPVYGYDDCFPTVDACRLPEHALDLPDHGELCWRPWEMEATETTLVCRTHSRLLPVAFTRRLTFDGPRLTWAFEAVNAGSEPLPFLHVMHALLPLDDVSALRLPEGEAVVDEITGEPVISDRGEPSADGPTPFPSKENLRLSGNERRVSRALERTLRGQPAGAFRMFLLRGVKTGAVRITRRSGLTLTIAFPAVFFPTLGIWWNNGGYPEEDGRRRMECAFEPLSGAWSSLERARAAGSVPELPAHGRRQWTITWTVEEKPNQPKGGRRSARRTEAT